MLFQQFAHQGRPIVRVYQLLPAVQGFAALQCAQGVEAADHEIRQGQEIIVVFEQEGDARRRGGLHRKALALPNAGDQGFGNVQVADLAAFGLDENRPARVEP